ncbi:unnamed protein product, partial [Discosporangium mesarthrocarpum]
MEALKLSFVDGVPVVFVLDEFERFACRGTQTLLYALLDLCQHPDVCVGVVGLSVNNNVLDVAEKRIKECPKSVFQILDIRFPHVDLDSLMTILGHALLLPCDQGAVPGVSLSFVKEFNATTQSLFHPGEGEGGARADIKSMAAAGRDIGWFMRLTSTAVALLGPGDKGLTLRALRRARDMLAPDPYTEVLPDLSVTE